MKCTCSNATMSVRGMQWRDNGSTPNKATVSVGRGCMFTTRVLALEGLKSRIDCLRVEFVVELLEMAV